MRLSGQTAVLLGSLALSACGDSTSPPPIVTKRVYVLESVDGRAVPTVAFSGPIETYTVLDGSLTLESNDSSIERFHGVDSLPQYGVSNDTLISAEQYRIFGDSIEVGFFGRCRDICIPNRIGVYSDSTVTLTYQIYPPTDPVYQYRLVPASSQ